MRSTEQLVIAAIEGDAAAYGELVSRYERAAIATAYAIMSDFHMSQDVAQEAFVSGYRTLHQLRKPAAFGPWLLRSVRRLAIRCQNDMRKRGISAELEDVARDCSKDWLESYSEVIQQLARLPEHERTVVVMRYVDRLSIKDISKVTGLQEGTITKQLSRAIQRLRDRLVEVKL